MMHCFSSRPSLNQVCENSVGCGAWVHRLLRERRVLRRKDGVPQVARVAEQEVPRGPAECCASRHAVRAYGGTSSTLYGSRCLVLHDWHYSCSVSDICSLRRRVQLRSNVPLQYHTHPGARIHFLHCARYLVFSVFLSAPDDADHRWENGH